MLSKIKYLSTVIAAAMLIPSISYAESNFSYDFFEVGISATTDDGESFGGIGGNISLEINNSHYITGHINTDLSGKTTDNAIGIGIGAYKPSSEETDYYSRAGVHHGKDSGISQQTLNIGFGVRHQMNESIELQGGIDFLFSTNEDSSGVAGNIGALYKYDDKIQLGGSISTDGDTTETRIFTRISML